jgi:hypothetical protein
MALAALLVSVSSAMAQTPAVPFPPTTTFDSTFADTQTWAVSFVGTAGKYVIAILMTFLGFKLVKKWIRGTVA